jgi:hypothetical protein
MEDLAPAINIGATILVLVLSGHVGGIMAKKERDKDDDGIVVAWIVMILLMFFRCLGRKCT